MDNLENKMKNTKVEGIIPKLFSGKMIVIEFFSYTFLGLYNILLNLIVLVICKM